MAEVIEIPDDVSGEGSSNGPSPSEIKRLVREFVLMTRTDSKCANYFLANNDWSVQKAVPDFVNLMGEIIQEDKPGTSSKTRGQKWAQEPASDNEVIGTFTFITWNVDGLDERNLQRRTDNIIKILNEENPDIVFLQEIVPQILTQMRNLLGNYRIISQNAEDNYFTVTLLKKETVSYVKHEDMPFPGSLMGRGLLAVEAKIGDMKLHLINTHLESTADYQEERVRQLKTAFSKLVQHPNTHSTIVAGDLNLRDKEVGLAGGIPPRAIDLWEACDSREACRYTWDTMRNSNCLSKGGGARGNFKPRLRFDRAYLHPCKTGTLPHPNPKHFGLVGIEKVPHTQTYTSDHWGLQVYFTINKSKS